MSAATRTKAAAQKVPVTERAVRGRLNRKLAQDGKHLHKFRLNDVPPPGTKAYYLTDREPDLSSTLLWLSRTEFEALAREKGVLRPTEEVVP